MPGIVGIITKTPHEGAELALLRMVEAMWHVSFYLTNTPVRVASGRDCVRSDEKSFQG